MWVGTFEINLHFLTSHLIFCYKASDFNVIFVGVSETEMGHRYYDSVNIISSSPNIAGIHGAEAECHRTK